MVDEYHYCKRVSHYGITQMEMATNSIYISASLYKFCKIFYEACKSTSPHFKFAMLILAFMQKEANVLEEWHCQDQYLSIDILLVFETICRVFAN